MKLHNHALRTLKFDISFYSEEKAFDLHRQISKLSNDKIYSIINKVCDEALPDRRAFVRIEKLEIDLGSIPYGEIEHLLPNRLDDLFGRALRHRLSTSNHSFTIGEPATVQTTESGHDKELLCIFLQQGILPWWAATGAESQLEPIFLRLLKNYPQETLAMIYTGNNVPGVIRRLACQFSDAALTTLVLTINPAQVQELIRYATILNESASLALPDIQDDKTDLWTMLLSFLNPFVSGTSYDNESLATFIITRLAAAGNLTTATLLGRISLVLSGKPALDTREQALQGIIQKMLAEPAEMMKAGNQKRNGDFIEDNGRDPNSLKIMKDLKSLLDELSQLTQYDRMLYENIVNFTIQFNEKWLGNSAFDTYAFAFFNHLLAKPLPNRPAFEFLEKTFRKFGFKPGKAIDRQRLYADDTAPEKAEVYYIANAGLVLFNPFLAVFFERAGLMDNKEFINKRAANKAIHLLQFLVDGSENHGEHLLLLNKILCGRDIYEPVEKEMPLSEAEKELSLSLLNAVISQWTVLKKSSVSTLRAEFLQRNGKLRFENGEWVLCIKHNMRSDYLLEALPWSLAMIKNSWMTEILNVEWT